MDGFRYQKLLILTGYTFCATFLMCSFYSTVIGFKMQMIATIGNYEHPVYFFFNLQLRSMTTDTHIIVDALQSSSVVEVQVLTSFTYFVN